MATIVLGARPPELEGWLRRRRELGQDRHDEVWEGRYVVEVLSSDDQTFAKLDFYAAHGVRELLVADWQARTVRCFDLQDEQREKDGSAVLGAAVVELAADVDWPQ